MSAHHDQLCRQFRCRAQDRRGRWSIAKQATAFCLEIMHALIKPLLPDLSHFAAEINQRGVAIELSIKGTHHRERIDGMNDSKVGLSVSCLSCARFKSRECGVGKVGRCQYLSRMSIVIVVPNPRRPRGHTNRVRFTLARIHFEVVMAFVVGGINAALEELI